MKVTDLNIEPKEIITDIDKLWEFAEVINPAADGELMQEIILSLKATMRANNLMSLSAPQIGYNKQVFCIKFGKNDYRTFLNPMIENVVSSTYHFARETCPSVPGKTFIIPRFGTIQMCFVTPMGEYKTTRLMGVAAEVAQHCIDLLNGNPIVNIGLEIDEDFDNATDDERAEILKMYVESLDLRSKKLREEINADEELKQIEDASNFIQAVNNGEVQIEN
jgi:peptide deformylase